MNLTELTLKNLSPGTYMDDTTPGFGIRVGKTRRTWIVVKGRGRVKTAIGHWPALTLSDARRRAKMALLAPGEPRSLPTFPEALNAFLAQDRWKPRSMVVLASSLKHFTWTRPLDKITHEDVAQALEAIPHKSARAHALKDIRTFFNWCVPRYLPSSPAQGLKMPTYKPRERVLTDHGMLQEPAARFSPKLFAHSKMTADVLASIYAGAKTKSVEFIPHPNLRFELGPKEFVYPDAVFTLKYPNGSTLNFALETDCKSERLTSSDTNQTSYADKFEKYDRLLDERKFAPLGHLWVLHVSNTPARMNNIRALTEGKEHLFKTHPKIGDHTFNNLGKAVLTKPPADGSMFTSPWMRVDGQVTFQM